MDHNLKQSILSFLEAVEINKTEFRLFPDAEPSLFASLFALFIFDLFGETTTWSAETKKTWAGYINSFQDPESGFFIPRHIKNTGLNSKPVYQLTAFALSALSVLNANPEYELKFLEQWDTEQKVESYLQEKGCLRGAATSGNSAMFLAIFLTKQFLLTKNDKYKRLIDYWFDVHDKHQNSKDGYWQKSRIRDPFSGFQNSVHQFEIYDFWNRNIKHYNNIVDDVLKLQDTDGFFAPNPGGSGCYEYDAANLLIVCGLRNDYRSEEVKKSLAQCRDAILNKNRNEDGGFCESKKAVTRISSVVRKESIRYFTCDVRPLSLLYKAKHAYFAIKNGDMIKDQYTNTPRKWMQSDLWNTWFRCLTIAKIERSLNMALSHPWNFQKFVGFGYFNRDREGT